MTNERLRTEELGEQGKLHKKINPHLQQRQRIWEKTAGEGSLRHWDRAESHSYLCQNQSEHFPAFHLRFRRRGNKKKPRIQRENESEEEGETRDSESVWVCDLHQAVYPAPGRLNSSGVRFRSSGGGGGSGVRTENCCLEGSDKIGPLEPPPLDPA